MSRKFKLWRYTTIIWSCLCFVHAGPLERSVRIIREVYPEIEPEKVEGSQAQVCIVGDVVYGAGETVPADQSCLKCKCQPPGVHCETTRCEKKPGCRAIHRPNNCCPVYQCECEYEGKTYANGERLDTTSGGECKVCYCRGGEVKCAEVSCYIRTDCEGRTVPGQCCPKYEHCPPIEPTLDKLAIIPDSIEFKSTTEAATRPVIYNTSNATSVENEIIETTPSYYGRNFTGDADASVTEINVNQTERELKKEEEASEEPKITIHEIIPEAKEITETQKEEVQAQAEKATIQGQLLVEEAIPHSHSHSHSFQKPIVETAANDLGISDDSDLESSEVSEVFQHPPPILRVGDQLLFLKKGEFVSDVGASTPSPVFTIIGAEGLQRGDIDSSEHHETQKEAGEFEEAVHFENVRNESAVSSSNEEEEAAKEKSQLGLEEEEKTNFTEASNAKREITVGQILVEEVTDGDKPQTQNNTEFGNSPTENNVSLENSTIDVAVQLPIVENDTEEPEAKITWFFTTTTTKKSEEEQNPVTAKTYAEDLTGEEEEEENTKIRSDEVIPLENPAYPPIPEIMSQQDTDEILEENTDVPAELELSQLKSISEDDEKAQVILEAISDTNLRILPEILTMRNNHSIPESVTHSEWLKATSSETLVNEEAVLPDSIIQQAVPSDEITTEEEGEDTTTVNEVDKKNATDLPVEDLKSEASSMMYSTIIEIKNRSENDQPRSTESLEDARSDEESGENTTPKNSPQQIHLLDSNENASVDDAAYQKDTSAAEKENSGGDVEMIDLHRLQTNATSHVTKRNVTHEEDSSSTARESESDKIFQQLGDEIQLLSTNATMGDDEKKEAQIIFKELFDEVNSTDVPKLERGGVPATARESAILQRVSDAIAKFQLKDAKSLDTSILGILRDFFSSQYKSTYKDN